jgi:hypothetical protein
MAASTSPNRTHPSAEAPYFAQELFCRFLSGPFFPLGQLFPSQHQLGMGFNHGNRRCKLNRRRRWIFLCLNAPHPGLRTRIMKVVIKHFFNRDSPVGTGLSSTGCCAWDFGTISFPSTEGQPFGQKKTARRRRNGPGRWCVEMKLISLPSSRVSRRPLARRLLCSGHQSDRKCRKPH